MKGPQTQWLLGQGGTWKARDRLQRFTAFDTSLGFFTCSKPPPAGFSRGFRPLELALYLYWCGAAAIRMRSSTSQSPVFRNSRLCLSSIALNCTLHPLGTRMQLQLTPDDVRRAHGKIQHHIHRTPVLTSRTLDRIVSTSSSSGAATPRVRLYFKCENFQKIGAFKARGAFHALKCLIEEKGIEEVRRKGVVAPSSGMYFIRKMR